MRALAALLTLTLPSLAAAQAAEGPDTGTDRLISTVAQPMKPSFRIWSDGPSFIKPVIQMSTSLVLYRPITDRSATIDFTERVSTLLLARIGFEGSLFEFLDFRTVFERNMGYQLSQNGPTGTSVWEGNASWQARENYLRLHWKGLSLTAGIAPDPATIDYISHHILDCFGMDPFVRDPLLVSGFAQGQTILLRYTPGPLLSALEGLTVGVGLTSGNPLVSSVSVGFGGEVNRLGSIFSAPRRAIDNGVPGSDIQMTVLTPSLTYERDFGFMGVGAKVAYQHYWVDPNITQREDVQLEGFNFRGTAQVTFLDNNLRFFGGGTFRENDNADLENTEVLSDDKYQSRLASAGMDLNFGFLDVPVIRDLGIGGSYYREWRRLQDEYQNTGEPDDFVFHYINVGMTYTIYPEVLYGSFRFSRFMAESTQEATLPLIHTANNFILALRLVI